MWTRGSAALAAAAFNARRRVTRFVMDDGSLFVRRFAAGGLRPTCFANIG
jgi:hypothetical protein